jgi:hypothetical protein
MFKTASLSPSAQMLLARHSLGTASGRYAASRGHDKTDAAGFQSGRDSSDEGLGGALADRGYGTRQNPLPES